MQNEHFFYWFFDPAWWISATQGAVGLLGIFGVYWFTRGDERRRSATQQTFNGIADITQKAMILRRRPPDHEERVHFLVDELTLFAIRERGNRRNASDWAITQAGNLHDWADNQEVSNLVVVEILAGLGEWAEKGLSRRYLSEKSANKSWEKVQKTESYKNELAARKKLDDELEDE